MKLYRRLVEWRTLRKVNKYRRLLGFPKIPTLAMGDDFGDPIKNSLPFHVSWSWDDFRLYMHCKTYGSILHGRTPSVVKMPWYCNEFIRLFETGCYPELEFSSECLSEVAAEMMIPMGH